MSPSLARQQEINITYLEAEQAHQLMGWSKGGRYARREIRLSQRGPPVSDVENNVYWENIIIVGGVDGLTDRARIKIEGK